MQADSTFVWAKHIRHTLLNTKALTEAFSWKVRCHLNFWFTFQDRHRSVPVQRPVMRSAELSQFPPDLAAAESSALLHISPAASRPQYQQGLRRLKINMHLYRRKQNVIDNPQSNLPANQLQSFFHNRDLHIQLTSSVVCFAL